LSERLPIELKHKFNDLLLVSESGHHSLFYGLKEYPPSASVHSIKHYLNQYRLLNDLGIDAIEGQLADPIFMDYLYRLSKHYNARDLKRFKDNKRYSLMLCFLVEARKILLDHLVKMHDQYIMDMLRKCKRIHDKQHRELRKRQKRALDVVLKATDLLINWPDDEPFYKHHLWKDHNEDQFKSSLTDLKSFKYLEEYGFGNTMRNRYPTLRKYFSAFLQLPYEGKSGTGPLLKAISIVRQIDEGTITQLPDDTPVQFVPKELMLSLRDETGRMQRSTWEISLAIAIRDALRSGDLYLPESKQHVSFWDLILDDHRWEETKSLYYENFQQSEQSILKSTLILQFHQSIGEAQQRFEADDFAEIVDGSLKLKRDDKALASHDISALQKTIDVSMPTIRIEQLLTEVDKETNFSRHFEPLQRHQSRPKSFYKTLVAAIISQATNLGVVAMSASVKGISVDMLRHLQQFYIREDNLKAASAEIINQHNQLPFSAIQGDGQSSSSDAQRFKIRADSLLASYYPRYYGYYEKAIGIYTHTSDQYAVFSTKAISCSPREALYVLDGLLENNTILKIREHTTDTHGYTEIVFALCHLLGFYFMPRIKDIKDQQLYRIERGVDYGIFSPLLTKTVDLDIIEEQQEMMIRVAKSLKERTAPAHLIVQRLTNSYPSDRLAKAFTNLGRIINTEYILRYITDRDLRKKVVLQLNKGEYRHKLARWIFFANQGEFTTGDYEEIMNKASCLSLMSNAILYWNTTRISNIIDGL